MTPSKELEELQSKRSELEEKSRQLDEKEQDLDERVRILEQRLAIRALEERNQTKIDAITNLESKITEMEQKLKAPSPLPKETWSEPRLEPVTSPEESEEEAAEPMAEEAEAAPEEEEPAEEYVQVAPVEDVQTPIEEDAKRQHDKKRRKFF